MKQVRELPKTLKCFICGHVDTRDKFAFYWRYYEHKNVPCCRDEEACKKRKEELDNARSEDS